MDLYVEVKSPKVTEHVTNKGNTIRKQQVALFNGADYPLPFFVTVGDQPYKPGRYQLSGSSFRVGRFGGLELDPYCIALEPLSAS